MFSKFQISKSTMNKLLYLQFTKKDECKERKEIPIIGSILQNSIKTFLKEQFCLVAIPNIIDFEFCLINQFMNEGSQIEPIFTLNKIRLSNGTIGDFEYEPFKNYYINGSELLRMNIQNAQRNHLSDLLISDLSYYYTNNPHNGNIFVYIVLKTYANFDCTNIKYQIPLIIACLLSPLLRFRPEKIMFNSIFSDTIYKAVLNYVYNKKKCRLIQV